MTVNNQTEHTWEKNCQDKTEQNIEGLRVQSITIKQLITDSSKDWMTKNPPPLECICGGTCGVENLSDTEMVTNEN